MDPDRFRDTVAGTWLILPLTHFANDVDPADVRDNPDPRPGLEHDDQSLADQVGSAYL